MVFVGCGYESLAIAIPESQALQKHATGVPDQIVI